VVPLTHTGSRFLLWCFEWTSRWWERLISLIPAPFEPGEAERRFGEHFIIERIGGTAPPDFSLWPPGFAAYLMKRNGQS
jgi:hypothetical protein